jgi:hypothetical protein
VGIHFGLLVARTDVAHLVEAFAVTWPTFESKTSLQMSGVGTVAQWAHDHAREVSARDWSTDNLPVCTFGFWQEGAWAVMYDPSYLQASDDAALAALSARLGTVLSFVVESAVGGAAFSVHEHGRLSWSIDSLEGETREQGQRPGEAAGLPVDGFFVGEVEQLQRAYGLTPMEELPGDWPTQGRAYIDRTDYSATKRARAARPATAATRSWWRFW